MQDEDLFCPICWVSTISSSGNTEDPSMESSSPTLVEFLKSPCGHVACFTCMERLLLSTEPLNEFIRRRYLTNHGNSMNNNPSFVYEQAMEDIVSSCPTKGKCPICRDNLDLFELVPITMDHNNNNNTVDNSTLRSPNNDKITDFQSFPFYDTTYIPNVDSILEDTPSFSFHFTPMMEESTTTTATTTTTTPTASYPFIRFENKSMNIKQDQPFESGFFFFPKSNTFHGKINWTQSLLSHFSENSTEWEVIIQFPSDYRCFSGGAIIKYSSSMRQSGSPPSVDFLGPRGQSFYRLKRTIVINVHPTYNRFNVWGNTFIQDDKIGFASYHFDSVAGVVYISYEHDDTCYWPPLDDGSAIPSRVPFINTSYDSESRTFRGQIAWKELYNTTWNGSEMWDYEMKFDTEFTCILSGKVYSFHDGQATELSEYGESLLYVNAALKQALAEQLSSSTDRSMQGFRTVALSFVHRLSDEGAPVRTIATFTSAVNRASLELFQSSES